MKVKVLKFEIIPKEEPKYYAIHLLLDDICPYDVKIEIEKTVGKTPLEIYNTIYEENKEEVKKYLNDWKQELELKEFVIQTEVIEGLE